MINYIIIPQGLNCRAATTFELDIIMENVRVCRYRIFSLLFDAGAKIIIINIVALNQLLWPSFFIVILILECRYLANNTDRWLIIQYLINKL